MYQYNSQSLVNPRVYFTVSRDGAKVGDIVFEVFQNHSPRATDNFLSFVHGCAVGRYKGTTFSGGYPGIALQGGRVSEDNASADGSRLPDESLHLRHRKRGTLSFANDGENANGSEFLITLSDTAKLLDGYHTIVGELVEGEEVLAKVEQSLNRHGALDHVIKIEECGTK